MSRQVSIPTWKQTAEWVVDGTITWGAFYLAKEWLIDEGKNLADQPLVTAAALGIAFVALKAARMWKAFDK